MGKLKGSPRVEIVYKGGSGRGLDEVRLSGLSETSPRGLTTQRIINFIQD